VTLAAENQEITCQVGARMPQSGSNTRFRQAKVRPMREQRKTGEVTKTLNSVMP